MKSNFKTCCGIRVRSGLTLIEVIVGLLLLATLLAGILMGSRRHARQVRMAQHRLEAIEAADRLLADLFAAPDGFPCAASGPISGNEKLTWHTRVIDADLADTLGVEIVRLAIQVNDRLDSRCEALATVDVLVPVSEAATPARKK